LERFLDLVNFTVAFQNGGFSYLVPQRNGVGRALERPFPKWADRLYPLLLNGGSGIFLDVGCNAGQTFLLWLKHRPQGLNYAGVDPLPGCCEYVGVLARKNGIRNAAIMCAGLGASSRLATLQCVHQDGSGSDMSSLEPSLRNDQTYQDSLLVPVVTGDSFVSSLPGRPTVSAVKIDVEGFEHEVLFGLSATLSRDRPLILAEVMYSNHPDEERRSKRRRQVEATNAFLHGLNYSIMHARHDGTILPLNKLPVQDWKRDDHNDYDFLFIPAERVEDFSKLAKDETSKRID
jgi:FkbM family methyltransferase